MFLVNIQKEVPLISEKILTMLVEGYILYIIVDKLHVNAYTYIHLHI